MIAAAGLLLQKGVSRFGDPQRRGRDDDAAEFASFSFEVLCLLLRKALLLVSSIRKTRTHVEDRVVLRRQVWQDISREGWLQGRSTVLENLDSALACDRRGLDSRAA